MDFLFFLQSLAVLFFLFTFLEFEAPEQTRYATPCRECSDAGCTPLGIGFGHYAAFTA